MKRLKVAAAAGAAALSLFGAASVQAIPTNVQFSTAGTGIFDVLGINQFDWQSSGDLLVRDLIAATACTGCVGGTTTSFTAWALGASVGQSVTFNIDLHARLNDMLDSAAASIKPATLDTNGAAGGDQGFEITAAGSFTESATLIAPGTLQFTSLTGSYTFFYDATPDSDVGLGTGFVDGTPIVSGTAIGTSGQISLVGSTLNGSTLAVLSVTSYNPLFIQTDPLTNQPLTGTNFNTLISLAGALQAVCGDSNGPGVAGTNSCVIGLPEYTKLTPDQVFKADANSQFSATPVPEPGILLLLGAALAAAGLPFRRKLRG